MKNRTNQNSQLPLAVEAMRDISITGNVVPQMWFKTVTFDNGKPDTNSILILSDIVYWYRPTEDRCERSGVIKSYKKKFSEDLLRRSYADLEEQFGLSKKQSRDCLIRLEKLGVIRRILRSVDLSNGRQNNVMYIELIPSVLSTLTHKAPENVDPHSVSDPSNFKVTPSLHRSYQGVPQKLPGGDIEVTRGLHRSYHHIKDSNTSSETSSNISLSPDILDSEKSIVSSPKAERENKSISKKMISVWNELVPQKHQKSANKFLARELETALAQQLDGNLENWRTVCENFQTSKFLMGEAEGVRINPDLSWLVNSKEPHVARVFSKSHWTFDDRSVASKPCVDPKLVEDEIKSLGEEKMAQDIRLFVLHSNPAFYKSYFRSAQIVKEGRGVRLKASSGFAQEKIDQEFSGKIDGFLNKQYGVSLT